MKNKTPVDCTPSQTPTSLPMTLEGKVMRNVVLYALHHVTYAPGKYENATSNGLGDAFIRKYIIGPFDIGLWVTRNIS